ncbi:MAG: zinc-binding dehydrogenase [Candidatus Bathyarchaeia archaeon]
MPLRIETVPEPKVKPNDVLIKVKAVGLCGSDVHIYHGRTPVGKTPIILGHEVAGVVEKVGSAVADVQAGDRVCVDGIIFCRECRNCMAGRENICENRRLYGIHEDGGFAEYIVVRSINCIKLPDNVPFEHGAILTDAVATPFHSIRRVNIVPGETVVIYGVGGLGIHAVQIASKLRGAKVIAVDVDQGKLNVAREVGATVIINAREEDPVKRVMDMTAGRGADVAIEAAGVMKSTKNALDSIRAGGRVVLQGLCAMPVSYDTRLLVRKEVSVLASYGYCKSDIATVVRLASEGRLDLTRSVTHKFLLDEVNKGIEVLERNIDSPLRIVVMD